MSPEVYAQLVALSAGTLLLTSVLLVWRHALLASIRLLAVQGAALALLVAVIGLDEGHLELVGVAVLVLALKGVLIPAVLARGTALTGGGREDDPRMNPTSALVTVALLTSLGYLVSRPVIDGVGVAVAGPSARAVPVGLTMVLIGFLLLATRRRALSQLVGFLLLDNGVATVAFLTAAGVPLAVELGISLDVLLVVLILTVLTGRMHELFGDTNLDELTELRD